MAASKPPKSASTPPKALTTPPKPAGRPVVSKSKPGPVSARPPRTFSVKSWTGAGEGEKVLLYGKSGIGKTTLAAMAPSPIFIGVDDGGRKIVNPKTGTPIQVVDGIECFQDIRDALHQDDLWPDGCSVVLDTLTKVDSEWAPAHILEHVTINGARASSFRKFGWDGDRHTLDFIRLLLVDLDAHARKGHNVILLCQQGQIRVANSEGADYLEDGPFLQHRNDCSVREEVKQWSDHVLRIGYLDMTVHVEKGAKAGKVVSQGTERAIFSAGAQHFTAKTRPVNGHPLPAVIGFEDETDDSLMQFLFHGATVGEGGDAA